jgi:proline iminopeptidase
LSLTEQYSDLHFALALATLETHYINNKFFIEENQVLANTDKIKQLPTYLVHGRYDMLSPIEGAWALHKALPLSTLRIIRDAGHSFFEPGIIDALIAISKELVL